MEDLLYGPRMDNVLRRILEGLAEADTAWDEAALAKACAGVRAELITASVNALVGQEHVSVSFTASEDHPLDGVLLGITDKGRAHVRDYAL